MVFVCCIYQCAYLFDGQPNPFVQSMITCEMPIFDKMSQKQVLTFGLSFSFVSMDCYHFCRIAAFCWHLLVSSLLAEYSYGRFCFSRRIAHPLGHICYDQVYSTNRERILILP